MEGIPDIEPFRERYSELDNELVQPNFFQDQRRAAKLAREHQQLSELIALYENCEQAERIFADNREMLQDALDAQGSRDLGGKPLVYRWVVLRAGLRRQAEEHA